MLTIDEYIAKMKKADKMVEFDYLKQSPSPGFLKRNCLTSLLLIFLSVL